MRLPSALSRLLVVCAVAAAGLHAVAACSTSDSKGPSAGDDAAADVVEEIEPVEVADSSTAPCKLTAKMTTGVALCDECLQKGCCQALVACLGEATCSAVNVCFNGCTAKYGTTDAGAQCARDCVKGKDEPAKRLNDAKECEFTRCGSQCK